jgi:apolipoprotein D and lipocalin family protein
MRSLCVRLFAIMLIFKLSHDDKINSLGEVWSWHVNSLDLIGHTLNSSGDSMKSMTFISVLTLSFIFSTIALSKDQPLPTPANVDIGRFIGKWYTISALPHFYTRSCKGQTAEYQLLNERQISVLNTCIKKNGETKDIEGVATIINVQTNAELEVRFDSFWNRLFNTKGDFTIIKLGEGYDSVMVGSKNRKSLWIMSRTPAINDAVYKDYVKYASYLNFKVQKLEMANY